MEINITQDMTLRRMSEFKKEDHLRINHEYQRGEAWNEFQQQMFIDSLLRGYHAPAFYFHIKSNLMDRFGGEFIEIIDGQQRVNAICKFMDDGFPLLDPSDEKGFRFPNFVKDMPCEWGGKRFSKLPEEFQKALYDHKVVVYEITTDDDNEVRDLFIRLQAGVPLTPQDKRDALPGNFTEFVLIAGGKSGNHRWYGWPLFKDQLKVTKESSRRQIVAQCYMLYHSKIHNEKFTDIKSKFLDQFYHEQIDFDKECSEAKNFEKVCEIIGEAFRGHEKLVGHHVIHLILLADELVKDFPDHWQSKLARALATFKECCEQASKAYKDGDYNNEFISYYTRYFQWTSNQSDIASNIQSRHAFFVQKMIKILDVLPKDSKRNLSSAERSSVYYRDERKCQHCLMQNETHIVDWALVEIHHVIPYSEGGLTELSNCALVHKDCHPKADETVLKFKEWWLEKNRLSSQVQEKKKRKKGRKGALPPDGTSLLATHKGQDFRGSIVDGKVILEHDKSQHKSLSEAARKCTGNSVNGWEFWKIKLPEDDDWVLAHDWRE